MKKALFKVILPALAIGIWVLTCYPVCDKAEGFDFFLFWILVGFPFGIRKMCMVLIPKNFGIAGSMGVWALNAVVGGLIGGVVLIIKVLGMAVELVKSKFLKLDSTHLQYVIGCMQNTTTKIANIKAYMITSLYNAPNTINHYYQQEVQHDMYGGGWHEKGIV